LIQRDLSIISKYEKVFVELGSGDGRLLKKLVGYETSRNILAIGIELDTSQYEKSCDLIEKNNIHFVNNSFEVLLPDFPDESIDSIISVLPAPRYIDSDYQELWVPFYQIVLKKLKETGSLILVTELTDDLFQPVSASDFVAWKYWLESVFISIGFKLRTIDGVPSNFSSQFLDQFKGDPERIKIVTLIMRKN
jgi:predicted membrane-bound spermidine synthase